MDASPSHQPNQESDCIHFNGLACKVCACGIDYETVKAFHTPEHDFSLPCKPSMSVVDVKLCLKYQPKPEDKTNE